jgi:RNA polymerase sigma-70 factor (ECF subfamily)
LLDISDAEAVRATLAGDQSAFAVLVERHLRVTRAVAFAVLGNRADAEDVTQDAFLLAYRQLADCRAPDRFRSWLLRIARNRAYNVADLIRVRRHELLVDTIADARLLADPALNAERQQTRAALLQAVAMLKPIQREVVMLHDMEGLSHAEIARVLGTSELMCRKHLMLARRQLRVSLQRHRD